MKILVTGGGGFLGSLVTNTLGHNHDVICFDHGKNFSHLQKLFNRKIRMVKGDICDKKLLVSLLKDVDTVVHLAGVNGEKHCKENFYESMLSNVYGTHVLLNAIEKTNVEKIIFSSSYWVYSTFTPEKIPIKEFYELRTDSFYGTQKSISELMIKNSRVTYIILRIASLYGYGLGVNFKNGGVVNKFIADAFSNLPLTVYGNGQQKIDLVYLEDLAKLVFDLLDPKVTKNFDIWNKIYNIGYGGPISVLEAAKLIKNIFKEEYKRTIIIKMAVAAPRDKIWPDKWLSINRIKKIIKNYPYSNLQDAIEETFQKYEQNLKIK